jgi:NADH-quinone oxidoreductase subunit B
MAVDESDQSFEHPLYGMLQGMTSLPGVDLAWTTADQVLSWGQENALWVFPMATSCCGIEFMAAACSRFDLDRIGTIARGTPRHCDVMVIAGTITVKMAPRVKKLWDQMPEPKWAIAMGSCAISGDFYRDIYSVVPGVDTFMPVDVYVPGCPPNPDHLMQGFRRLQEKIRLKRAGQFVEPDKRPIAGMQTPSIPRIGDPDRDPVFDAAQIDSAQNLDPAGGMRRADAAPLAERPAPPAPPQAEVKP